MGYYIQGPLKGKATYIRAEYGAYEISKPKSFAEVPAGKALICVADNGPFEAACYCYDEREFLAFNVPTDHRPKKWLIMDKADAQALTDCKF